MSGSKTKYFYINGMGNGKYRLRDRLMDLWWQLHKMQIVRFAVNWYGNQGLQEILDDGVLRIDKLLGTNDRIIIVGSSAGASMAVNIFCRLNSQKVLLVCSRGRIRVGNYSKNDRRSIETWSKTSQLFYDSVMLSDDNISSFSENQKQRIVLLTPLVDEIVPLETMKIDGITTRVSFAIGHFWGYLVHMVVDLPKIKSFLP